MGVGNRFCGNPLLGKCVRVPAVKKAKYDSPVVSVLTEFNSTIQVFLVICGRYVPSFWTANLEFADKKPYFDWKIVILDHFFLCDLANLQIKTLR
jgi:hypothetical protein